jgi:TolB-like protein/tetratricopeptide (TPR) repeat protein
MPDLLDRLRAALVDRYAIEREIGRGGMATVYLAEDLKHRRKVAIKVLDPELARALGAERFLREVEITARLNHPHILPLLNSGQIGDQTARRPDAVSAPSTVALLFYVMPYVEGETLRERMTREGQLPLDDALEIAREVAAALSYAHSRGVIHRDVKPENVLLSAGEAVVADFGIARAITEAGGGHLTETGISIGTPVYMSPEQAAGAEKLDGRSDIYALGCVLYEMLAGEPPYTGPTAQAIMAKKLSDAVPRVSVVRELVPRTVETALTRALAKAPADRFRTAHEFVVALSSADVRPVERPAGRRLPRLRGWRTAAAAAAVVLLGAGGWWAAHRVGEPAIRRLAVLPLASFTNDSTQQYFVQGVHDALIFDLQQAGVRVVGRTSVLQYAHTEKPIRQIARELGVDGVIEGSVLRAGDSVEIALRLIDARTEEPRWQRSYPGDMRNILTLYHGVTRGIAREIRSTLSPQASARLANARTVDPQAYDDYLKGQFHWRRLNPGDLEQAFEYFQRALRRDSTYALAYVGIAMVWAARAQGFARGGFASIREAEAQASAAVRKALALDSTLAEVQGAVAAVRAWHEWDWTGADSASRKARQMNPNDPYAHAGYSQFLYVTGRAAEGRAQIDSAVALDSTDGGLRGLNGVAYLFERRYDEAIAESRRALELGNALGFVSVDALYLKGAQAEARAELRKVWADDQEMLDAFNQGYAEGGDRAALHRVGDVWASRPPTFMGSTFNAATWYALAGDRERTLQCLERAYELHDPAVPYIGVDPHFDLVRDDPRFKDLLRRMGLPNWTATRPS